MEVDLRETGALIVRAHKGVPFYEAKWRDPTGQQRKRRLGRAWLEPDPAGGWIKRRGKVRDDFLDEKRAYGEMSRVIAEVEAEQQIAPRMRDARFEDAVKVWFEHLEFEKRAKPSTLSGYRSLLARPEQRRDKRNGARIMREFGGRKLTTIAAEDVHRFLGKIDREGISARTVNVHRQILHSIFDTRGEPTPSVSETTRSRRPPSDPRRGRGQSRPLSPRRSAPWRMQPGRACTAAKGAMSTPTSRRRPSGSGFASTSKTQRSS
jgi:hypothetical protein